MLDGSPHGATLHYDHNDKPLMFFMKTSKCYKKSEPILNKDKVRASFVVGADESLMKTLQMDGIVRLVSESEREIFDKNYYGKFPGKVKKDYKDDQLLIVFIPTWWRFTNWTTPRGKEVTLSE